MRVFQAIKQAYLSLVTDDSSAYPQGQAGYGDKTSNFLRYSPYGLFSNPPKGSWVLLLSSQGQEAVKIGLIADFLNRKKNTNEGECGLYNTLTGTLIHLKSDGSLFIDAKGDLDLEVAGNANINITGDAIITTTGKTEINSGGDADIIASGIVNLGALGGFGVARIGDAVSGGVITGGSTKVKAA